MGHLPILLGGCLFFAVIIVLAVICYALLQMVFELVDVMISIGFGVYGIVKNRGLDPDDIVGVVSTVIFLSVLIAFFVGGLQ